MCYLLLLLFERVESVIKLIDSLQKFTLQLSYLQKQESSSEDGGYEEESDSSVDVEDMSSSDGEGTGNRRITRRSTRVQTRATKGRSTLYVCH